MIFLTGDTHGNFARIIDFTKKHNTTKDDLLIMLGDVAINYLGKIDDAPCKHHLNKLPITFLCIHGNHEMRPESLPEYKEIEWNEGLVYMEPKYPFLLFAKDGEVYNLNGTRCIAIGGAYSIDKFHRLMRGLEWWKDEQPSAEIKQRVEKKLDSLNWTIDVVLSHTAPMKYEPHKVSLEIYGGFKIDKSTEEWLNSIEDRLTYKKWYCGHFHTNKIIDKMRFLYKDFVELYEYTERTGGL